MSDHSEDFSNGFKRTDYQHTLRFETVKDLHNAVLVFAGERAASQDENIRQYGESGGGMAAVFTMLGLSRLEEDNGGRKSFAQKVVDDIGSLSSDRGYHGSWDYDGPGPFHKATIAAKRLPDNAFSLHIHAAYVGNEPEVSLAHKIGAPIGYGYCDIERTWASTQQDRFAIPVKDIEALYTALGQKFDEKEFLKSFATPQMDSYHKEHVESYTSPVSIVNNDAVKAEITLTNWRSVPAYEQKDKPGRDYGYRLEKGYLTGPARIDHGSGKPMAIGIQLYITPAGEGPTYDAALEQRIRKMGDAVEAAWKVDQPAPSQAPRLRRG
jgi:hypothetical protein